ncbi:Uncharacterised protein [Klebsiella pneumoniae subsp. ozaenae]|uniref:Uncharacterized protein n=1 Tax=Klebsiella pneumoniae subsp. ozaenae TaxID=574 RepID=A0A377YZ08_KLEPO|nr:Uncharacterised protein [Klebsiella pneumoniae subsp. ozaenae]
MWYLLPLKFKETDVFELVAGMKRIRARVQHIDKGNDDGITRCKHLALILKQHLAHAPATILFCDADGAILI